MTGFKKAAILSKILQLALWLALSLFILFLYHDPAAPLLPQWLASIIILGMATIPTYYAAYRLVPRLLYQKLLWRFIGLLLLAAVLNTVVTYTIVGALYHIATGRSVLANAKVVEDIASVLFATNCMVITIGCAIKIIIDRFRMEEQLIETEQEKISTELAFLRAQINPHFLFNVINTIYFQIHKENTEARNSVEKLSEMLRYQLYECTTDKIDIAKELAYIENYVAVQQLRMEPGTDVQLHLPENAGGFKIAPLLILPIVENAFKHVSHYKNPAQNKLHISLTTEDGCRFVVQVRNTFEAGSETESPRLSGGLGLQNTKRRLALLYPNAHSLNVRRGDHTFETTLKIQYSD